MEKTIHLKLEFENRRWICFIKSGILGRWLQIWDTENSPFDCPSLNSITSNTLKIDKPNYFKATIEKE